MRVALICIDDAREVKAWSGIPFHVARALEAVGAEVTLISPLEPPRPRVAYARWRIAWFIGRSYRPELEGASVRGFTTAIQSKLALVRPDLVLSLDTVPLADLETDVPVALWIDATFPLLEQSYREFATLSLRLKRRGMKLEAAGLQRANVVFCASRWALESAKTDFGIPAERLDIAPFGANLSPPPKHDAVVEAVAARHNGPCRLIFIGADWERKRGDFAIAVAENLHQRGRDVVLSMFGATPPKGTRVPDYVVLEGFVDKQSAAGGERLNRALLAAHVLLLPSRAECFGIAVAEANAAGVPCLGTAVGGLIDAITPGRNGRLLPPNAEPGEFADAVAELVDDSVLYSALARSSRSEYSTRLNWETSVRAILRALSAELDS